MMFQRRSQSTSTFACTIRLICACVCVQFYHSRHMFHYHLLADCMRCSQWLRVHMHLYECVFSLQQSRKIVYRFSYRNKHSDTFICFLMHSCANLQSFFTCLCLFFFSFFVDANFRMQLMRSYIIQRILRLYFIHIVHCLFDS